ncbi:hypothetical protein OPV22_020295 [Ensete ventricosum]|uniref:Uncharacterized protein n=1 Tax=Ensete ventricosum TaxID=4639 RepID=A0AAV8QIG3_ENSVE|nr:hypothetical protein OPV22_020295 [Ensete ventricosum]
MTPVNVREQQSHIEKSKAVRFKEEKFAVVDFSRWGRQEPSPTIKAGFAMPKATTTLLILVIVLLRTSAAAAAAAAAERRSSSCSQQQEDGESIRDDASQSRKLLVDLTLDYDLGGPNTRHDHRKGGKPGSVGKKPWTSLHAPSHI